MHTFLWPAAGNLVEPAASIRVGFDSAKLAA